MSLGRGQCSWDFFMEELTVVMHCLHTTGIGCLSQRRKECANGIMMMMGGFGIERRALVLFIFTFLLRACARRWRLMNWLICVVVA